MSDRPDSPQEIAERGYDQVADAYARLERDSVWPRMRWLDKLLDQLEAGSSVLDLGCGSGDPGGRRDPLSVGARTQALMA